MGATTDHPKAAAENMPPAWEGRARVLIKGIPPAVTRVDLLKELMAAGPTGRVLVLRMELAGTRSMIGPSQPSWATATVEYDTRQEMNRLVTTLLPGSRRKFRFRFMGGRRTHLDWTFRESGTLSWQFAASNTAGSQPPAQHGKTLLPSRVLRIVGPSSSPVMEEHSLRKLFTLHKINTETELVTTRDVDSLQRVIEWRFCDWATQARLAYLALEHIDGILVAYGLDPCARGARPELMAGPPKAKELPKGTVMKVEDAHDHKVETNRNGSLEMHKARAEEERSAEERHNKLVLRKLAKEMPHLPGCDRQWIAGREDAVQVMEQARVETARKARERSAKKRQQEAELLELRKTEAAAEASKIERLSAEKRQREAELLQLRTAEAEAEAANAERISAEKRRQENVWLEFEKAMAGERSTEERRTEAAHPDLDTLVRALAGETRQQEEEGLLLQMWRARRAPQSALPKANALPTPAPKSTGVSTRLVHSSQSHDSRRTRAQSLK